MPGSKPAMWGMVIPHSIGNPYIRYKKPYYWVFKPYYWVEFPIPYHEAKFGQSMHSDLNHSLELYRE